MIKVEPCKGCGGVLLVDRFMGVTVRCEATPLDAQAAGAALLAGQTLYRIVHEGGRPHQFTGASPAVLGALAAGRSPGLQVVPTHRCTAKATGAPLAEVKTETVAACPKGPEKPVQGAARGRSVEPATPRRSEGPRCSGCGEPCQDGTYASIALGELTVWAVHTEGCGS